MVKDIKDICVIIQARLGSQRIPGKMLKPFADTTLVDILLEKLTQSTIIPKSNIYFSVYEEELKQVAQKYSINIFHRSKQSSNSEGLLLPEIFEWHTLPFKYVILISACNPLLKLETIDNFISSFIKSSKKGGFAVFKKKNYFWDTNGNSITDWKGLPCMNTKMIDHVYEAAHCLYASPMNIIKNNQWLTTEGPDGLELFDISELESFDIDYEWQFNVAEQLYKNLK